MYKTDMMQQAETKNENSRFILLYSFNKDTTKILGLGRNDNLILTISDESNNYKS